MSSNEKRALPKTRIASLFIGLNIFAVLLVLATIWTGFSIPPADKDFITHLALGLVASVIGLGGLVSAMFYLITTGAAVKQAVTDYKLDVENNRKTALLKKTLFPACMGVVVLLITTTIVGGGVHVGSMDKSTHLYLSILLILAYMLTVAKIRKDFHKNRVIMADVIAVIDEQEAKKKS